MELGPQYSQEKANETEVKTSMSHAQTLLGQDGMTRTYKTTFCRVFLICWHIERKKKKAGKGLYEAQ